MVGVTTTPRHLPALSSCMTCPKLSMSAQFQVLAQPPSLPPVLRAHSPTTTTTTSHAPPHHPYAPFPVAVSHGAPKSSHNSSVSGFGPNPLPASRFASAQPHHRHHLIHTTTPPLPTVPLRCSTWCTRNRATTARFWL